MTPKQVNVIVGIIFGVTAILVLTGALFWLQHYPNSPLISGIGSFLGTITFIYDIIRLKKRIKKTGKPTRAKRIKNFKFEQNINY